MKKLSITALLFFSFHFLIGQSSPFSVQDVSKEVNRLHSFSLPFSENWSSGSLETNNWTKECEYWAIDFLEGNEMPSVKFRWDPTVQEVYNCSLTSDFFNGDVFKVGQIILEFDVTLNNRINTGTEKLLVEIFDGTAWYQVAEFVNNGNIDWMSYSVDIAEYALGKTFQIRFRAKGPNSFNIKSWHLDNISLYRTCEAPNKLVGSFGWDGPPPGETYREIAWDAPVSTIIDIYKWMHWGGGIYDGGIGLTNGGDFSVASKWENQHLTEYYGDTIQSIRFILNDNGFTEIVAKIWTGPDGENLIYQDTVDNPIIGSWNEIELDSVILIAQDTIYWVGYTIIGQPANTLPAGYDQGPAIPGYGDLIKTETNGWDPISDFGIDHNFLTQMKLLNNNSEDSTDCFGFNIYRRLIGVDPIYYYYAFSPFVSYQHHYYFKDIVIDFEKDYCYKVAAVWSKDGDTCISDYAKDIIQIDDFICLILIIGIDQNDNNQLTIYPNPANNILNVTNKDGNGIEEITLYNLSSQKVFQGKPENGVLDISKLPSGMYIVEVLVGEKKFRQKVIVD